MPTFAFDVTEFVYHTLEVEAADKDEALRLAAESIELGEFGTEDFASIEYNLKED